MLINTLIELNKDSFNLLLVSSINYINILKINEVFSKSVLTEGALKVNIDRYTRA